VLGLILSLSACGKVEVTMQEIYEASHMVAPMDSQKSIYVKSTINGADIEEFYVAKDYDYSRYSLSLEGVSYHMAYLTTDHSFYFYSDDVYGRSLLVDPDGLSDAYRTEAYDQFVLAMETTKETIQSVEKKGNQITVTSTLDPANVEGADIMGFVSANNEYVLDAKTRELITSKSLTTYSDGTTYDVFTEYFHDAEAPDTLKTFLAYDQQTENLRTITVVSNPGATNEKSQSVQVPKGLIVTLEPDLGTDKTFTMYSDAACTKRFAFSENYNSDATIYVKWSE
jgi:hypothetical protein